MVKVEIDCLVGFEGIDLLFDLDDYYVLISCVVL